MLVGDCVGEAFCQLRAHAELLDGWQGVVEGIGVTAIGLQGERAVEAGRASLGQKAERIAHVYVSGCGQGAVDAGIVFIDGGHSRAHQRGIVGAVDGDGQSIGSRCAVLVGDCVGEAFCQLLTSRQALHGWRGIVQYIGVVSGGVHAQAAVEAGRAVLFHKVEAIVGVYILRRGQSALHKALMLLQRS